MLIFLDIDGVMVPAKSWKSPELLMDGFPAFDLRAVKVLQNLISDNTTVVLTTSHKSRFSIQEWKEIFQKRSIQVEKLASLCENINNLNRKDEILNWFNLNDVNESFVIIDDDKSLNDLPPFLKNKLVLISPIIGLTDNNLVEIETALNQSSEAA